MAVEFAAGWIANSLALLSDAGHMMMDAGALGLSLFAAWVAKRPGSPSMSFGYHRAEILGALANGLLVWLLAGVLIYEAGSRFQAPPSVDGTIVAWTAFAGLVANLVSMRILHSRRADSLNVRAAYLHLFTDCLGSVGALISGLLVWKLGWLVADPIVTVIVALLMLYSSWRVIRESVGVLMQETPPHLDAADVLVELQALPGVQEAHDLHIWAVSTGRLALSVHLISPEGEGVLTRANALLEEKYAIVHTTIQVEHPERFRSERCYDCAL